MARISFDILKTIKKGYKKPLENARVLDVGCWNGRVSLPLLPYIRSLHGVDIRRSPEFRGKKVSFTKSSVFDYLNNCSKKFDIIICSEVIEHIEDQIGFLKMIKRCLSDDGIVFLTTNNKYWWKEGHYGLPFLTFLPKRAQKSYIKAFNKERTCGYEVTELFSYSRLKRYFRKTGYEPEFVIPEGLGFLYSIMKYVMKGPMWNLSVGFMVIARKNK
ncbi:methyltransferase domain-containing protein [Candidatus Woesearchaeota archaeon]|nr:methyltransferase domain-containing protein [Candidatus Woesearchaeota archaeon]